MADSKDILPPSDPLKRAVDAAALATPAILLLTGCLYYAGYIDKKVTNSHYGLSDSVVAETFQQTVARGFVPSFVILFCLATVFFFIFRFAVPVFERRKARIIINKQARGSNVLLSVLARREAFIVLAIVYFGISGAIAGVFRSSQRINVISAALSDGCAKECFVYVKESYAVVGVPLAQDEHRIVVITRAGARLIKADDLEFVRKFDPVTDGRKLIAGDRFPKRLPVRRPPATP